MRNIAIQLLILRFFTKIVEDDKNIKEENNMKKYALILLIVLLAGCSNSNGEPKPSQFTAEEAVSFEIVAYEDKIAPVYAQLVPHIAYAETEAQLELLKARFDMEQLEVDITDSIVLFVVAYSDTCGIAMDGVYNHNGLLSAQMMDVTGDACEKGPVPHTFVLKVPQADYEKVQLFNGNIMKSSMDIK